MQALNNIFIGPAIELRGLSEGDIGSNTAFAPSTAAQQNERNNVYLEQNQALRSSTAFGCENVDSTPQRPIRNEAQMKIEAIFDNITDAILSEKEELSVELRSRHVSETAVTMTRRICFPGKTPDEAWRFAMVIRILEIILEALVKGVMVSKRDIYYRDPALFGNQNRVDRYVDDIAFSFGLSRTCLNVAAAAKGLLAGALSFSTLDGTKIDTSGTREGILVPHLKDVAALHMESVKWVLVVEKEATFRTILSSPFGRIINQNGALVTGKGYPDLATRALLHSLTTPSLLNGFAAPPVYGLADFDPDGLSILVTYKCGSRSLAHEGHTINAPNLTWVGIRSDHLTRAGGDDHGAQGLLALSARDRRKAFGVLNAITPDASGEWNQDMTRELQTMLMLNMKAETQLLDTEFLTDLLSQMG